METQKEIADTLREYQTDYLLALKTNQPKFFEDVKWLFQDVDDADWQGFQSSYSRTEEISRAGKNNAQTNLLTLRHIALNMLKQDRTSRIGFKAKRKRAGWDRP